jgi:hypothetical protein
MSDEKAKTLMQEVFAEKSYFIKSITTLLIMKMTNIFILGDKTQKTQ